MATEARKRRARTEWSDEEVVVMLEIVEEYGTSAWERLSREMFTRHFIRGAKQCADKFRSIKKKVLDEQLPPRPAEKPTTTPTATAAAAEEVDDGEQQEEDEDIEEEEEESDEEESEEEESDDEEKVEEEDGTKRKKKKTKTKTTTKKTAASAKKKAEKKKAVTDKVLKILIGEGPTAESGLQGDAVEYSEIADKL